MEVIIRRPKKEDQEEIRTLFATVITDAFNEQYEDPHHPAIKEEVAKKTKSLQKDFETNGKDEYFLIAENGGRIVGTIAFGKANQDIRMYYTTNFEKTPEIKSAYILPEYQGKGVGTKLFNEIINALQKNGYKEFCMDSGYTKAQHFWKKKVGDPVKIVTNRWGAGNDYLIWHQKLS